MIDIKDLQIGNKVLYKCKVVEIATTHITGTVGVLDGHKDFIVPVSCKDIEPIEVTNDLLVNIGFKPLLGGIEDIKNFTFDIGEINIIISNYKSFYNFSSWIINRELGSFDFNYLHELQNGIRLITKGDLEVCL